MELAALFVVRVSDSVCVDWIAVGPADRESLTSLFGRLANVEWMDCWNLNAAWLLSPEEVTNNLIPRFDQEECLSGRLNAYPPAAFALTLYVPTPISELPPCE